MRKKVAKGLRRAARKVMTDNGADPKQFPALAEHFVKRLKRAYKGGR